MCMYEHKIVCRPGKRMRSFASPAIGAAKSPVLCVATHLWLEGTVHPTLQATYAGATPIGTMRSCRNATDIFGRQTKRRTRHNQSDNT